VWKTEKRNFKTKMYLNRQLGWTGPSGNYAAHSHTLRTPAYKHLVAAFAVCSGALFAGTTAAVNVLAGKQVAYQPAVIAPASPVVQPAPPVAAPAPQASPPAAQPAVSPPVTDHSAQVQAVLNSWIASHSSQKWSVVVQGLGSDPTKASVNPANSYNTASVYKLFLMYPLFKAYDLNSLAGATVTVDGRGVTNLKTCVELAIKNSDNPCGEAIGRRLGWGKSTTLLRQLGMSKTDLNTPNAISTTAADTNLFLQKLNAGQLMSPDEQQYLLALLQQQKYRSGIPAGCPSCIVSDKTGDLGSVRHDVGIVQYSGGSYSLTIMTNGAPYSQIAQLTSQIQQQMQ
jgi:hypothetical protein